MRSRTSAAARSASTATRSAAPGVDLNALRRDVGIVFQSYNLFPHMSVLENITLGPTRIERMPKKEAHERAMRLLESVGMAEKAKAYPDSLSGGQQQRVAIVRALAMQPRVMLLDEITAALDPELVGDVLEIVRELARGGLTMLLATHEMGFAKEVASQVCFLDNGSILERGIAAGHLRESPRGAHPAVPQPRREVGTVVVTRRC